MGQETAVLHREAQKKNWSKAVPPGLRRGLSHASEASVPQNPCDQLHTVVHTCNSSVAEMGTDRFLELSDQQAQPRREVPA